MKPIFDDEEAIAAGLDPVEDEALKVNGLTREELAEAPDPKIVWEKYCEYLKIHNLKGNSGKQWDAPGKAGFNNCNFDDRLDEVMCERFGPSLDAYGGMTIYHPFINVDAFQILQNVFNNKKLGKSNSLSMDAVREYMDYSTENAHDAKTDVLQGADLTIRFLKLFRAITDGKFGAIKFKGCAGGKI
jgi:DNA polymerase III epsilon subunit-like protein